MLDLRYYRQRRSNGNGDLFRVPFKDGTAERVIGDVSGAAPVSPDGRRIAFVRLKPSTWEASLMVSNANGSREFAVMTVPGPRSFDEHGVVWSPNGQSLACLPESSCPNQIPHFAWLKRIFAIRLNALSVPSY
jgi:hypothetical protein